MSYIIHRIPKKADSKITGWRVIEEPEPGLKATQKALARSLAAAVTFPGNVHGVSRTSNVTNSIGHIKKAVLYKLDLKNFFQTITIDKIYRSLPEHYHQQVIDLCMLDGRLPTGAPTSPILANIAFLSTDQKILDIIENKDITYTRYMDDLSFSCDSLNVFNHKILKAIIQCITADGYTINRRKSGISLSFERQKVTGVIVNQKPNLSREERLLLRARLDHLARSSTSTKPDKPDVRTVLGTHRTAGASHARPGSEGSSQDTSGRWANGRGRSQHNDVSSGLRSSSRLGSKEPRPAANIQSQRIEDPNIAGLLAYVRSIDTTLYSKYITYYNKRVTFYGKAN